MEQYIAKFSAMEREQDIDGMTDTLIRVTERVARCDVLPAGLPVADLR
mgnify:CR=1 FL=1